MNLLVIGASSDIGISTIEKVVDKYDYILAHYRNENDKFVNLCNKYNDRIIKIKADLENNEDINNMIACIMKTNILPDHILHLAAKICINEHFHKMSFEEIYDSVSVGLFSLCRLTKPFIKNMINNRNGKIVVMLSRVIETLPPYCSQYIMTKYAMLGYIKALASEYNEKNILFYGISPDWINTKYILNQPDIVVNNYINKSKRKKLLESTEVANIIEDVLLNDKLENGTNLLIDEEMVIYHEYYKY